MYALVPSQERLVLVSLEWFFFSSNFCSLIGFVVYDVLVTIEILAVVDIPYSLVLPDIELVLIDSLKTCSVADSENTSKFTLVGNDGWIVFI